MNARLLTVGTLDAQRSKRNPMRAQRLGRSSRPIIEVLQGSNPKETGRSLAEALAVRFEPTDVNKILTTAQQASTMAQIITKSGSAKKELIDKFPKNSIERDLALSCSLKFARTKKAEGQLKSFAQALRMEPKVDVIAPTDQVNLVEIVFPRNRVVGQPLILLSTNANGQGTGTILRVCTDPGRLEEQYHKARRFDISYLAPDSPLMNRIKDALRDLHKGGWFEQQRLA